MKLLTLILLLFFVNANAQTKKETEDWLLFNLNKYLGDNFEEVSQPGREYDYYTYDYEIKENKFIYTESTHHVTISNKPPGTITNQTKTTINLSKIIKVSQENSGLTPPKWPSAYYLRIYFNFVDYPDIENPGVKQYDVLNKKDLIGQTYYSLFTAIFINVPSALKDDMPSRLTKAFEHLAELNGAKIIKDVF